MARCEAGEIKKEHAKEIEIKEAGSMAGVGLLLCVAGMAFSVRSQGNTPVGALSMCFSSILFSVASLMYGWKSFKEEEKNYIFAKIGTILSGLLVIWWIVTILIGIRG